MKILPSLVILFFVVSSQFAKAEEINIGVLALRGKNNTHQKWDATAKLLSQKIDGYHFNIVPLGFSEIDGALARRSVDFLLANSSIYVNMEQKHQIGRIATLKRKTPNSDDPVSIFGGVIFTKKDTKNITCVHDLKGKTFAAVDETSLGGWHMAWRKMLHLGFDPHKELRKLSYSGTHDKVVYDVLSGKVEAGTIRSGVLESMAKEGKISLNDIKVIEAQECEGLNLLNSTQCYPEWPIAKLKHTSDSLANQVAITLISLDKDNPAIKAASIYGWSIPYNYTPVHDLRRELKLPPYDTKPEITLREVFEKYGFAIILTLLIMVISIIATISILRLNFKLNKSRNILKTQYDQLKTMQKQLVESEKLASLGGLVAGVSHEINTPVGMALTGITHLVSEVDKLHKEYDAEQMSEEDFSNFLKESHELGNSIELNLKRAANLVRSFKQVAVDQSSEELRAFNAKEYTAEILTSLQNTLKKTKHHIKLDIDPNLTIHNYPGAFSQVLTNLIMNSVIHGYDKDDEGHITIQIKKDTHNITLVYSDDGKGISKENLKKIFDPFYTTNREHGGSGLGLNIIYNIVTQKSNGDIKVQSELGRGVTFTITVPIITNTKG